MTKTANTPASSRKHGASSGDQNALRHGFYSRRFSSAEIQDLEAQLQEDFNGEIALLRVFTRRIFELVDGSDNLNDMVAATGAISTIMGRITSMMRVRSMIGGNAGQDVARAISEALSDIVKELNLS